MRIVVWLLLLCVSVHAAAAGLRSVSHSEWRIAQRQITVRIEFPAAQAAALTGRRFALLTTENVGLYVLDRIGVSAGGTPCPATDQGYDLGKVNALSLGRELYGFEVVFLCAGAAPLTLRNALFMDDFPGHTDYAQVESAQGRVRQLFTAEHPTLDITPQDPAGVSAVRFVPLGAAHVARSWSRLAALVALMLLAGARRGVLLGSLAAGYLLSWLLGFTGLQPDTAGLEAIIGFVSVAGAFLLVAPAAPRRPYALMLCSLAVLSIAMAVLRHPPDGLLLVGLAVLGGALLLGERQGQVFSLVVPGALFGLVDGFVLPGDFSRLQLDRVDALPLAAFDAGSLLSAALCLGVGWAGMRLAERSRIFQFRLAMRDLATSLLSGLGVFWMLSPL